MSKLTHKVITTENFYKVTSSLTTEIYKHKKSKLVYKFFATRDSFYCPEESEYLCSTKDTNGNDVNCYVLASAKAILILSIGYDGCFKHSLYKTMDDSGLYLNDVLDLLDINSK